MFNLLVTVISIALVAVLALAGLWFGGDIYTAQQSRVAAQTLTAQATQIYAASQIYYTDHSGSWPATTQDLVPHYLKVAPVPPSPAMKTAAASTPIDFLVSNAYAGVTGRWELLHDSTGRLVYIKLQGASLHQGVCKAVEATRDNIGLLKSVLVDIAIPVQVDPEKLYQCAQDSPDATAMTYFWRVPGATAAQGCDALTVYNGAKGTNFQCGSTGGPATPPPSGQPSPYPDIPGTCTLSLDASSVDRHGNPSSGDWGMYVSGLPDGVDISQSTLMVGITEIPLDWAESYGDGTGWATSYLPVPGLVLGPVPVYLYNADGSVCRGNVAAVSEFLQVTHPGWIEVPSAAPTTLTYSGRGFLKPGLAVTKQAWAADTWESLPPEPLSFQILDDSTVVVTIPPQSAGTADSFDIYFQNTAGEFAGRSGTYSLSAAPFAATSVTPSGAVYAYDNTLVTILGYGLTTPGLTVGATDAFGNVLQTTELSRTSTAIVLEVAAVGIEEGWSDNSVTLEVGDGTNPQYFGYQANAAQVWSVAPWELPPGGGPVTVTGHFLTPDTTLIFGATDASVNQAPSAGVSVPLTNVDCRDNGWAVECTADAIAPPYSAAAMGGVPSDSVGVTTVRDGHYMRGLDVSYAGVRLWSVSPASIPYGGGAMLTLLGDNFTTSSTVTVNGIAAQQVIFDTPTKLRIITPALGAGLVNQQVAVTVTDPLYGVASKNVTVAGASGYLMAQYNAAQGRYVTDAILYPFCTTNGGASQSTHPYVIGDFASSGGVTYYKEFVSTASRNRMEDPTWASIITGSAPAPTGPYETTSGMYPNQVGEWNKPYVFAPQPALPEGVGAAGYQQYNGAEFSVYGARNGTTSLSRYARWQDRNTVDPYHNPLRADGAWVCMRANGVSAISTQRITTPFSHSGPSMINGVFGNRVGTPWTVAGSADVLLIRTGTGTFLLQNAAANVAAAAAETDVDTGTDGAVNRRQYNYGAVSSLRESVAFTYGSGSTPWTTGGGIGELDITLRNNTAQRVWVQVPATRSHYVVVSNTIHPWYGPTANGGSLDNEARGKTYNMPELVGGVLLGADNNGNWLKFPVQ